MKKKLDEKWTEGADGPTAFFTASKKKMDLSKIYLKQEKKDEKRIAGLKPNAHTLEELEEYLVKKYHAKEIAKEGRNYQTIYKNEKLNYLMENHPELFDVPLELIPKDWKSNEEIETYLNEVDRLEKVALDKMGKDIPIDVSVYVFRFKVFYKTSGRVEVVIEKNRGAFYIATTINGNNKWIEKLIIKEIYQYYGVTQSDIDNRTSRLYDYLRTSEKRVWGIFS